MPVDFEITNFSFLAGLGFSVAIASFGMMLYIAGKQSDQSDKIEKMIRGQTQLVDDTRDVYASEIVGYIQLVSDSYGTVMDYYQNNHPNGGYTVAKENAKRILNNYYDSHLFHMPKIEFIELVKVFGKDVAKQHWKLHASLMSGSWQTYSDHGMALLMHSYKQEMDNLVKLKDLFLSYCDDVMKERDGEFQENYDLIKKEKEAAVKPRKEDFPVGSSVQDSYEADLSNTKKEKEENKE